MKESFNLPPTEPELDSELNKSKPVRPGMIGALLRRFALGSALASAPLAAAKDIEGQKIDGKSPEKITQVESVDDAKEWIKELADTTITVGNPHLRIRDGSDAKGIYKNGVHIGDVFSRSVQKFDKDYFLEQVDQLLDQTRVAHKEIAHPELVIDPAVFAKMDELGIAHRELTNDKGIKQLIITINKDTGNVDDLNMYMIDMEDDKNENTYARLSLKDGVLVLSGRQDDQLYNISFVKSKDGKKIEIIDRPTGGKPVPSVKSN